MKKVFLLICFLISVTFLFSQTYPQKQGMGNDKTLVTTTGSMQSTGYVFGYYSDTVTANAAPYLKYTPNILITVGDFLYKRNQNATGWVKIGGAGSTNTSVGLGFPLAVNNTNDVKKLYQGYGIKFDSTSVVQSISTSVDTSQIATQYKVSVADSINSLAVPSISGLRAINYQSVGAKMKSSSDKILIRTAGYYQPNDGGGGMFYWDDTATVADNGGSIIKPTSVSGAGRWKKIFYRSMTPLDFGAKGDGVTDDWAAFVACYNALPRTQIAFNQYTRGDFFVPIPQNYYYLSDSLLFEDQVNFVGQSSTMFPFGVIKLSFRAGVRGVWFRMGNPSGGSRGSRMANMEIVQLGTSLDTTKHGVEFNGITYLDNVKVSNFGGHGIYANTLPPYGGNANISYIVNCSANDNGLNGIMLVGGESSAITVINPNCQTNGRVNIEDAGFLGSTVIGGHTAINGISTGRTSKCWVLSGGSYYCAKEINVNIQPGITSGWGEIWAGPFVHSPNDTYVSAWAADTTYHYSANLASTGESQAGGFIQVYNEVEDGGNIVKSGASIIFNGVNIPTWKKRGAYLGAKEGFIQALSGNGFKSEDMTGDIYVEMHRDYGFGVGNDVTGERMGWMYVDSMMIFFPSSNTNLPRLGFNGHQMKPGAIGTGRDETFAGLPMLSKQGIFFTDQTGSSGFKLDTKRMLGGIAGTTPAADGSYFAVGDQLLYLDVAASGTNLLLLRNTVKGQPGTWAKIYGAPDVAGNASKVLAVNAGATGTEWVTPSSGSSAAGNNRDIQINNNGIFGAAGSDSLEWTGGKLSVKGAVSILGSLQLQGSSSGLITMQGASAAGTYTLTLPTNDGNSGEVLSTDGSGVLSWVTNGGGTGSPVGNFGNVQLNRNGVFATPGSDSLDFVEGDGLYIKGAVSTSSGFSNGLKVNGTFLFGDDGSKARVSPTAGIMQMFTSGSNFDLSIFNGGGDSYLSFKPLSGTGSIIETAGSATHLRMQTTAGTFLAVGNVDPQRKLHVMRSSATTNAIEYAMRIDNTTSGTATTGYGTGFEFAQENASGTQVVVASIEMPFTDATNASEDADMVFKNIIAGTNTEVARFTGRSFSMSNTGSRIGLGASPASNIGFSFSPSVGGSSSFGFYGRPTMTPGSGGTVYGYDFGGATTEFSSGTHSIIATVIVNPLTITGGSATVTNTATLYVGAAMSTTVTGTNWGAYFESGPLFFGGPVRQVTNTTTSSSTPTPNADATNIYTVTALATNPTFGAPTGTPVDGQSLLIRIKDNGSPRTLGWNAIYRQGSISLPVTTVASETMYLQFIYNSADVKWDFIGYTDGF